MKQLLGMKFDIYQLSDPGTGDVRYVGYSKNAYVRFTSHLRGAVDGCNTHKAHWILSLLRAQKTPVLSIVAQVQGRPEACRVETMLIASLRARGYALVNGTPGGDGGDTYSQHPELSRLRKEASARLKARWADPGYRKEMCELSANQIGPNRGRVFGEDTRAKVSAASKKRFADAVERAKCGQPGRVVSSETRRKLSEASRGRPGRSWSSERRGALSTRMAGDKNPFAGKKHSEETRRKMREAKRGVIPWNKGLSKNRSAEAPR